MVLNPYIWNLYKESEAGQQVIEDWSMTWDNFQQEELDKCTLPIPEQYQADVAGAKTVTISLIQAVYDAFSHYAIESLEEAIHYYHDAVTNGIPVTSPDYPEATLYFGKYEPDWYDNIGLVAWGLYLAHPEFFVPYLFRPLYGEGMTFQILEEISTQFDISLPALPAKRDKLGKALYYGRLLRAFYDFRQRHRLNPAEMCAFLYDFSLNVIEHEESEELPSPSKVWLLKGGRGDFEIVEQSTSSTVFYRWGGNLEIRRGDILLMYLLSPRSAIHSIWRALSDGFVDPFFHYHDAVAVGAMVKTKPVTFQEIKQDPTLSQKGLIRANLQGASGDPFSVEEYNAILRIMANKGQDITILPKLEPLYYPDAERINNERDVERFLVEPLLAKLGYTEDDWIRQMPVKMGRGERFYPDYAFGAVTKRGEESAEMVLEAKYRISTRKELREAFYQAKSYALRLRAQRIVLCAIDGVWMFEYQDDDFGLEGFVHKSWNESRHPDVLHEVSLIIGRGKVLKS